MLLWKPARLKAYWFYSCEQFWNKLHFSKHFIILAEEMEAPYVNMKKMASFAYRQVKLERKLIKAKANAQKRKKHAKEVNVNYLVFVSSLDNVQRWILNKGFRCLDMGKINIYNKGWSVVLRKSWMNDLQESMKFMQI